MPAPPPAPGAISAIRELARRAGRYAVEVGGGVLLPVSVETIAEFRLQVGRNVDREVLARLLAASAMTRCFDHALDALARRGRATRELERWLEARDHPREAIGAAVERLTALGLLDDVRFAEAYVAGPARAKGFGVRRVAAELRRRGVPAAIVARALAQEDDVHAHATLEAAAARRARALRSLAPEVAQRRLIGWLVRRGFAPGAATRAARAALAGP